MIFTSDVCHGTYPQVKGLRQTLNLDFNLSSLDQRWYRTTVNRLVPGSIPGRGVRNLRRSLYKVRLIWDKPLGIFAEDLRLTPLQTVRMLGLIALATFG